MNENCMSFFMYFVSFVLKKGDIKWYTRKSVFCNQISYGTSIWIYHMEWVSYRARFYEFWLILHVVFLYRIRTDILKLSSFTQKTIWSQKNSTKNILHLRTEIKTLTLHLIFFFKYIPVYKIHEETFPYLSELPPNMNECRSNSLWWLLSRSKHDYGLLKAPRLRSFKDIVNLDTVRRFILCWSRENTISGFIYCIFIFTPTTGSRWAKSLGWVYIEEIRQ